MVGAGSHEIALLRALARSSFFDCSTSLSASARTHRFYSTSTNWSSSTPANLSIAARKTPLLSRPNRHAKVAAPSAFVQCRRGFASTPIRRHEHLDPPKPGEELHITFIDKQGHAETFEVAEGDNLLDIAMSHDVEMEGACGGSCACSTCHVVVEKDEDYDKMEEPTDEENDMLDQAFGLKENSRLGCQVKMSKALDGLVVRLPLMTKNLQASDFESR